MIRTRKGCLLTYLLTHSLTHLPTHLLTYSLTYLLTYSPDTERLDFLVCNLQRWAVERHGEEEILAAQWDVEREEREQKIQLEKAKIEREKRIIEDELVVQEDYRITQEAMRMMRVTGAKEGVNVPGGEGTYSLTYSLTHLLTYSLTFSPTHSPTHSPRRSASIATS